MEFLKSSNAIGSWVAIGWAFFILLVCSGIRIHLD
jgi:hypothetical protein